VRLERLERLKMRADGRRGYLYCGIAERRQAMEGGGYHFYGCRAEGKVQEGDSADGRINLELWRGSWELR